MFSKLMIMSFGQPRSGGPRNPTPLLNARALEDVFLLGDVQPAHTTSEKRHMDVFRRWREAIAAPNAAEDGFHNP